MKIEIAKLSSILLIDDDIDLLDMLAETMLKNFLHVYKADSAKKGIEMLHLHSVDCVVVDFKMPYMDGGQFAKFASAYFSLIPVILLTGSAITPKVLECLDYNVFDIVMKPYHEELLINTIQNSIVSSRYIKLLMALSESTFIEFDKDDYFKLKKEQRTKFLAQLEHMLRTNLAAAKAIKNS
ncbi:MAG: response regulator [Proteobacteria bacterium]|nr:response regulator [Pseudomonadota bacterium]